MGLIICFFLLIFFIYLIINLTLYIFESKVKKLDKNSKLTKLINIFKNNYESLYNYLSVHQIISVTSVTIYVWYEYIEIGCFDVYCFLSDTEVSSTQLVKLEVIVTIILLIG